MFNQAKLYLNALRLVAHTGYHTGAIVASAETVVPLSIIEKMKTASAATLDIIASLPKDADEVAARIEKHINATVDKKTNKIS